MTIIGVIIVIIILFGFAKHDRKVEEDRKRMSARARDVEKKSTPLILIFSTILSFILGVIVMATLIARDVDLSIVFAVSMGIFFGGPILGLLVRDRLIENARSEELRNLQNKAQSGDAKDLLKLAEYYEHAEDPKYRDAEKGLDLRLEAADRGDAESNYKLGVMALYGTPTVPVNPVAAFSRFRAGARLGSADAAFRLSQCLERGVGVERNASESREILRQAAADGSPDARFLLATQILANGQGDRKQALEYLAFAAERLVPEAATCLADAYERGVDVERNLAKAVNLYESAAENGDPEGMFQLGLRLFYGIGRKRQPKTAWKWLRRAARMGVKRAEQFAKENQLDLDAPIIPRKKSTSSK